ncbi:MAG: SpoIIE family protein phosphatase [Halioglobus sp.]
MTKSINAKLIATLTVCCAAILCVGMLIDYSLSRTEIMTRLKSESLDTINAAVTDLENSLDAIEGVTLFFGRILAQGDYTQSSLEQMLQDIVENNDDVYGATIALNPALVDSPRGFAPYYFYKNNTLSRADLTLGPDEYWRRPWYENAVTAGKPVWIEPYFDSGGGETLMTTYSVPVYRQDENSVMTLYGVITADVTLDELQQYLQRLRLGQNSFGILLSREGVILSARNPESIMQHYQEVAGDSKDSALWDELVNAALKGQLATRDIECPNTAGPCVARMSALQSTGWPVGIIYSENEILEPLRSYQIKTASLGLITILGLALVVTLVSRRLTAPLIALAQVTDQIALGKFDVPLPRIQGEDEVARLILAFSAMKKNLKTFVSDLENATAARGRLEGELAAAREIQMAMLPQAGEATENTDTYALWATVKPAKTVGGDLYTYYCDDSGQLFFALGDVSDKGVPAALFMAKTISHIQQFSRAFIEPGSGMALLNNALEAGNSNCMFVTLFFGVVDFNTHALHFASAGHTPPCVLRDGKAYPVAQESGPALGLAPDQEYPLNVFQLQSGDRIAIYTDGIDEAFNDQAKMYGTERLESELEKTAENTVAEVGARIIRSIDEFAGVQPQSDDISLMLIDIHAR